MKTNRLKPAACGLLLMLCGSLAPAGPSPQVQVKEEPSRWVIEAVGTESMPPDLIHLMMKMEFESSLAADATRQGEAQLNEFLAAADRLQIPALTHRVANNLITPAGEFSGFVYTRNIIFTFARPQPGAALADVDGIVARLEDLGARYNSHCVTCIGSG